MGKKMVQPVNNPEGSCEASAPSETASTYFMYVLSCSDQTLYTGYTTDIEQRFQAHNAGKGAKYTRGRTPVELMVCLQFETKHEAMSAEYHFKKLSRQQKETLIASLNCCGENERDSIRQKLLPHKE